MFQDNISLDASDSSEPLASSKTANDSPQEPWGESLAAPPGKSLRVKQNFKFTKV